MEPIGMRQFPDFRGEKYGARQIIFKTRNNLGLSAVTVESGDRWDHGWYCNPGQYEVMLVDTTEASSEEPFNYDFIMDEHGEHLRHDINPEGWIDIEDIGQLLEAIEKDGIEGYINWRKSLYMPERILKDINE